MTLQLIQRCNPWQGADIYLVLSVKNSHLILAISHDLGDDDGVLFAVVDIFFVAKLGEHAIAYVGFDWIRRGLGLLRLDSRITIGCNCFWSLGRFGEKTIYMKQVLRHFQLLIVGGAHFQLILGVLGMDLCLVISRLDGFEKPAVVASGVMYFTKSFCRRIPLSCFAVLIQWAFRGVGAKHIMQCAHFWIANGLNIFLDPLFIFGFWNVGLAVELERCCCRDTLSFCWGSFINCTILF